MTAAPHSLMIFTSACFLVFGSVAITPVPTRKLRNWKSRLQRATVGLTPRYPSHKVTKAERSITALAPRWWLEAVEVDKISEELAHRQAESAVEVCPEDHSFAGPGRRHELVSGDAEVKGPRDLAGAVEYQDLHLRDIGPLPSATLVTGGTIIPHRDIGRRGGGRRRKGRRGRRRS